MKVVVALLVASGCLTLATPATAAQVGIVAFENSGAPAAQEPFLRGLALLHNFEYARAAIDHASSLGLIH